ncbi:MAG: hypothetical protein Q8O39_02460 [bacterium]|nr:hypothetical protein [bacterium]
MKKTALIFYFLLVINFIFLVVLFFSFKNCSQIFEDYLSIAAEKRELETIRGNYLEDLEFIRQNKTKIEAFDNSFVNSQNPLLFISYLEKEVSKRGLIFGFADISNEDKENSNQALNFKLKICGPFPKVSNFLGGLEESPYILRVKNLSIFRVEKETQNEKDKCSSLKIGEVNATLEVETPIKIF